MSQSLPGTSIAITGASSSGLIKSQAELSACAGSRHPSSASNPGMSWARAVKPSVIDQKPSSRRAFIAAAALHDLIQQSTLLRQEADAHSEELKEALLAVSVLNGDSVWQNNRKQLESAIDEYAQDLGVSLSWPSAEEV